MSLLSPTYFFRYATDIDVEFLCSVNCQGLILDIDDTLAPQESFYPEESVLEWIRKLKDNRIKMIIASNNTEKRVSEFAQILEVPHIFQAKKPFRSGLKRAIKMLSLPKDNVFMVGDQVFSDVLGANFIKINSILVEPLSPAKSLSLRFKRKLEMPVRKKLQITNLNGLEYTNYKQGVVTSEE